MQSAFSLTRSHHEKGLPNCYILIWRNSSVEIQVRDLKPVMCQLPRPSEDFLSTHVGISDLKSSPHSYRRRPDSHYQATTTAVNDHTAGIVPMRLVASAAGLTAPCTSSIMQSLELATYFVHKPRMIGTPISTHVNPASFLLARGSHRREGAWHREFQSGKPKFMQVCRYHPRL